MQAQVQALLQLLAIAREAVKHPRHPTAAKASRTQDLCKLCACVSAVHEQGLAQLERQLHLCCKPVLLHVWRAEVAVEVQPTLTCMFMYAQDNLGNTISTG
jgi:hypothetical protein